ncbi:MAG TPA: AAA family ATPase [Patescibacteria group bacterium]|nr:AAA family ATPase [Patescibacteria group bacterium]
MKINYIQISNILSFEYRDDINHSPKINFDKGLNILIGPNGVGKSNFLEILNQLFKNILYRQAIYSEDNVFNHRSNGQVPLGQTITEAPRNYNYLNPNRKSTNSVRKIKISLNLNQNDKNNLKFIFDNATDFNTIFSNYSNVGGLSFETNFNKQDIDNTNDIEFEYEDTNPINQPAFHRVNRQQNQCVNFIEKYFEYFEFLQKAIQIGNTFENKQWNKLKQTFALMGSFRTYNMFDGNYPVNAKEFTRTAELKTKDVNENTRASSNEEPVAFMYVKKELAFRFNEYYDQYGKVKARKLTLNLPIVKNINKLLLGYLNIQLDINKLDLLSLNYSFKFIDEKKNEVQYSDLSAGQKAIIHFIFCLYGYDIEKGLLIIDEPETHLHPQMQEKFLNVINQIKDDLDIQFIIVTHSPMFINAKVINNTYRFSLVRGFTKVIHPKITNDEAELVRILSYTNSIKIFFSKKVVLIEGDSDEYFYRKFYDYYKEIKNKDPELEFLYISGKGSFELWKNFLNKYKVKTYFIGDWDNVVSFNLLSRSQLNKFNKAYLNSVYTNIAVNVLSKKGSTDRVNMLSSLSSYISHPTKQGFKKLKEMRGYMLVRYIPSEDLVNFIKTDASTYSTLQTSIADLYKKQIYILQEGELEEYLGTTGKGLDVVIAFCKNDFENWIKDQANTAKIDEITKIFDSITA